MKQLCDIGVSAIRVSSVDNISEVAKGKYRFGMLLWPNCKKKMLDKAFFVVFLAPETLQLPDWKKVVSGKIFQDRLAVVAAQNGLYVGA